MNKERKERRGTYDYVSIRNEFLKIFIVVVCSVQRIVSTRSIAVIDRFLLFLSAPS